MPERLWHDRDPLLAAAYRELLDGIRNGDTIETTESRIAFVVGLAVGVHERLGALTGPEPERTEGGGRIGRHLYLGHEGAFATCPQCWPEGE